MADGSDGPDASPEVAATATVAGRKIWGTLEELLLACAVSRHGTASWDSVALEVQTRSPLATRPRLTPGSCRLRFQQLHRRFSVGGREEEEQEDPDASAAEGWLDELRRLRVAELRREVERCDLSIGTLETKVNRLREDRERSLSGEAKPEEITSEEAGRSCRESNSTDLKPSKHPREQSVKEEAAKQEASGESVAASKDDSSDVRSSASLCRRRRTGADDEEASAPRPPVQSQPLAALFDTIEAKFGSVFERLKENQESPTYRGTIKRHVDLETVRRKLDRSAGGSYPRLELYRDLLLLCSNAAVFFPRPAPEHAAAVDAHALVCAQVSASLREPKQERGAVTGAASAADSRRAEPGADIVGPLIEKTRKPLIFCRKRSSIAKASAAPRKEESAEKVEAEAEEESEGEKKSAVGATKGKAWGLGTKKKRGPAKNSAVASAAPNRKPVKAADDAEGATTKADKKGAGDGTAASVPAKKRNALDFVKRMDQGSSTSKKRGSPLGARKRTAAAAEPEQHETRRGPGRKNTGRGGGRRGGRTAATKRSVGRPSKRGADADLPTPPPSKRAKVNRSSSSGKRGRRK